MDCVLETRGLTKVFGRGSHAQTAVDGVDLHVETGRVYGLLGPNGAGKSTLLKMVTGMLRPTSGSLLFDGHPWQRDDLYDIGSLIETPPLYPNLTAQENMRVRAMMLGTDESDIASALETAGISHTGSKRAGSFSLGMKQRLGIALALMGNPKLLVLDEPTNGLDPIGIEDLRGRIRSFADSGITVIVSSHVLAEVSHVADRVGIIAQGTLAFEGEFERGMDLEALFMDVCRGVAAGFDATMAGGAR
ncbi:MAG: lantibiotic protection ABC transporter ATP-binding protein [Slackia sp.]|nr:lantibiotic protection ABC transporter ATP-binding protein [Slackia sp.]